MGNDVRPSRGYFVANRSADPPGTTVRVRLSRLVNRITQELTKCGPTPSGSVPSIVPERRQDSASSAKGSQLARSVK